MLSPDSGTIRTVEVEDEDVKPTDILINPQEPTSASRENVNETSVPASSNSVQNCISGYSSNFTTSSMIPDMVSFLVPPLKPRSEFFYPEEIKVMLEEVGFRKNLLLSPSPSTNRLKRRAWEEVAANIASRLPHVTRRTADQVKKKWENLVSTTKRKIRAGHVTPELDWNETNATIVEFLSQHSPIIKLRYAHAWAQSRLNPCGFSSATQPTMTDVNSVGTSDPMDFKCDSALFGDYTTSSSNLRSESHVSFQPGANNSNHASGSDVSNPQFNKGPSLAHSQSNCATPSNLGRHSVVIDNQPLLSGPVLRLPTPSSTPYEFSPLRCDPELTKQMQEQMNREHALRMDILRLQKHAWELQIEMLRRSMNDCQPKQFPNGSNFLNN